MALFPVGKQANPTPQKEEKKAGELFPIKGKRTWQPKESERAAEESKGILREIFLYKLFILAHKIKIHFLSLFFEAWNNVNTPLTETFNHANSFINFCKEQIQMLDGKTTKFESSIAKGELKQINYKAIIDNKNLDESISNFLSNRNNVEKVKSALKKAIEEQIRVFDPPDYEKIQYTNKKGALETERRIIEQEFKHPRAKQEAPQPVKPVQPESAILNQLRAVMKESTYALYSNSSRFDQPIFPGYKNGGHIIIPNIKKDEIKKEEELKKSYKAGEADSICEKEGSDHTIRYGEKDAETNYYGFYIYTDAGFGDFRGRPQTYISIGIFCPKKYAAFLEDCIKNHLDKFVQAAAELIYQKQIDITPYEGREYLANFLIKHFKGRKIVAKLS